MNKNNLNFITILIFLLLIIVAVFTIYPVFILLYTSFGTSGLTQLKFGVQEFSIFKNIFLNYSEILSNNLLPRLYINTIVISVSATFIVLLISSLAAFGFAFLKIKFKNIFFLVLLMGIMLPAGVSLFPLYLLMAKIHLTSNLLSVILILSGFGIPFALLIIKNSFDGLPKSILDAGRIDGCNNFYLYLKIVLPMSTPALTAVAIFVFLGAWNEYLLPLVFLKKAEWQTLQLIPKNYISQYSSDLPLMFAGMVLAVLPIIVIYVIFQNKFVQGLTAGALKE